MTNYTFEDNSSLHFEFDLKEKKEKSFNFHLVSFCFRRDNQIVEKSSRRLIKINAKLKTEKDENHSHVLLL